MAAQTFQRLMWLQDRPELLEAYHVDMAAQDREKRAYTPNDIFYVLRQYPANAAQLHMACVRAATSTVGVMLQRCGVPGEVARAIYAHAFDLLDDASRRSIRAVRGVVKSKALDVIGRQQMNLAAQEDRYLMTWRMLSKQRAAPQFTVKEEALWLYEQRVADGRPGLTALGRELVVLAANGEAVVPYQPFTPAGGTLRTLTAVEARHPALLCASVKIVSPPLITSPTQVGFEWRVMPGREMWLDAPNGQFFTAAELARAVAATLPNDFDSRTSLRRLHLCVTLEGAEFFTNAPNGWRAGPSNCAVLHELFEDVRGARQGVLYLPSWTCDVRNYDPLHFINNDWNGYAPAIRISEDPPLAKGMSTRELVRGCFSARRYCKTPGVHKLLVTALKGARHGPFIDDLGADGGVFGWLPTAMLQLGQGYFAEHPEDSDDEPDEMCIMREAYRLDFKYKTLNDLHRVPQDEIPRSMSLQGTLGSARASCFSPSHSPTSPLYSLYSPTSPQYS